MANMRLIFDLRFIRDDEDDEGDDEDDDEEVMTEAERMEEGRRMFQIFAARMFEQRVLTAYREKVSPLSSSPLFCVSRLIGFVFQGRLGTSETAST